MGFVFFVDSRSFFGFCLIWALGGSNIGQKTGGRLTKILPARQTHFGGFFGQPFGEKTFSEKCTPKENRSFQISVSIFNVAHNMRVSTRSC